MSISPGATIRPVASMVSSGLPLLRSAISPSAMNRSPTSSRLFAGSMMWPLRMRKLLMGGPRPPGAVWIGIEIALGDRDPPCLSCRNASAEVENGHAHREAVRDLIENDAARPVGEIAVDLDSALDRSG